MHHPVAGTLAVTLLTVHFSKPTAQLSVLQTDMVLEPSHEAANLEETPSSHHLDRADGCSDKVPAAHKPVGSTGQPHQDVVQLLSAHLRAARGLNGNLKQQMRLQRANRPTKWPHILISCCLKVRTQYAGVSAGILQIARPEWKYAQSVHGLTDQQRCLSANQSLCTKDVGGVVRHYWLGEGGVGGKARPRGTHTDSSRPDLAQLPFGQTLF